jgi:hypothetical protein
MGAYYYRVVESVVEGREAYFLLRMDAIKLKRLEGALKHETGSIDLADYGKVMASGFGKPTPAIQALCDELTANR